MPYQPPRRFSRHSHRRPSLGKYLLLFLLVIGVFFALGQLSVVPPKTVSRLIPAHPSNHATASAADFGVPVLMYHYIRVVPDPTKDRLGYNLSVTPTDFTEQMSYLVAHHFTTITPDDLARARAGRANLPPHPILLTFDDGYQDFYTTAFPILERFHLKATAFIVTGFVDDNHGRYLTWDEIRTLDQSGLITIGAHTVHHVDLKTAPDAQTEIVDSKTTLETMLHHAIGSFAYPSGSYDAAVIAVVRGAQFTLAFTTHPGLVIPLSPSYELPRVRIAGNTTLPEFAARLTTPTNHFLPHLPNLPLTLHSGSASD